ncbi:MAG: 8-amino-7-oxononanoate synthase [Desulfuromonas sp.]|nr:8-amino-7-oxononanoate synthase [Desulfuromonas sp.]
MTEIIQKELDGLQTRGRFRSLAQTRERSGTMLEFNGRYLLNLSSNDYLGLAGQQELLETYLDDAGGHVGDYAMTSSSSRLLTGNHPLYDRLELQLAALYGREAAMVFNSGYHANTGILPALSTRHDLILSDKLNHASIIDGGKIADATFKRYRHLDYAHLESLLAAASGKYRQVFIITESVFSMDGDLADLRRLCDLKEQYQAMLIVDEAHSVGTFGDQGQGLCEAQGVTERVDIIIGTFGKALASTGAYAVLDLLVRDYLINTMRPFIFTTALPPAILGWSIKVLEAQQTMQAERHHLQHISGQLRDALTAVGLETYGDSHIVPVIIGSDELAVQKATQLRDHGMLALPVRPPTVPENTARLRFSLRADLRWDDIAMIPQLLSGEQP